MSKRKLTVPIDEVTDYFDRWLEDEEDREGDNLDELNCGNETLPNLIDSDDDDSEIEGESENTEEERPVMRKVYKKKVLTKKRLVNSIG